MQINDLKIKTARKTRKTVGRGGKKGTYSGRGCKGQKSRSGASINPLFEGGRSTLIDHMKKKRGFKSNKLPKVAIKFSALAKKFKTGETITLEALVEKKLLRKSEVKQGVKVLGPKVAKFDFTFDEKIFVSKSVGGGAKKAESKKEVAKKETPKKK